MKHLWKNMRKITNIGKATITYSTSESDEMSSGNKLDVLTYYHNYISDIILTEYVGIIHQKVQGLN